MGFHGLVEETIKIVDWIADMGDKTLQKERKQVADALLKANFALLKDSSIGAAKQCLW